MPDPTLNASAQGQGPAFPVTGPGGVSGPGVIPPSQGLTKHDALVQALFMNQPFLDALAANGGSFTTNIIEGSEDFSGAAGWTLDKATNTANVFLSPTNWLTGSRLTEDGTAAVRHRNASSVQPVTPYAPMAISIYAQPEARGIVYLGITDGGYGDFADLNFNLATKEVTAGQLTGGLTILGDPFIEDAPNGWTRIGLVVLNTNQPSRNLYYGLADADGNQVYDGDGASSAGFFGAQLENESSVIHTYKAIPTTAGGFQAFQGDFMARFVRDYATEVMGVRGQDLRDS